MTGLSAERLAEIRAYEPAAWGFVPIHPKTLAMLCDYAEDGMRLRAAPIVHRIAETMFTTDGPIALGERVRIVPEE